MTNDDEQAEPTVTHGLNVLALETQEAGTGKWFPIVLYAPGTDTQREEAREHAELLRKALGLYVRVTGGQS